MHARTFHGLIYILRDSLAANVEDGFEQGRSGELRAGLGALAGSPGENRCHTDGAMVPVGKGHERDARLDPGLRKLTSGLTWPSEMRMESEDDLQVPGLSNWVGRGALHWGRGVQGAGGWNVEGRGEFRVHVFVGGAQSCHIRQ